MESMERIRTLPATRTARDAAVWLIERLPGAISARIYPGDLNGLAFEFDHGPWDLSIEISGDGSMLLFGVETDGPREIEPETFGHCDFAVVLRLVAMLAANDP